MRKKKTKGRRERNGRGGFFVCVSRNVDRIKSKREMETKKEE